MFKKGYETPRLSDQEYLFIKAENQALDEIPITIDIDKVLKYLARKLQQRLRKSVTSKVSTMIKTYKGLLMQGSSLSQHVIYLLQTKSLAVLKLAMEVFSTLSEKIRLNIMLQTLRYINLEVYLILCLIDGLAIGTKYIWDLIKTTPPQSNLYRALIHKVDKSALAEQLVNSNSKVHLEVLLSESSTLDKKLIQNLLGVESLLRFN